MVAGGGVVVKLFYVRKESLYSKRVGTTWVGDCQMGSTLLGKYLAIVQYACFTGSQLSHFLYLRTDEQRLANNAFQLESGEKSGKH